MAVASLNAQVKRPYHQLVPETAEVLSHYPLIPGRKNGTVGGLSSQEA